MRSPPWRASDPSAARASAIRRAVNPSPPAILKSPPCAGFLIWIAEFADKNPGSNRAALARRARCAARPGGRATRAQARASAFRRAVNPSPPAILKDPPCAGFLIWIAEFADLNPVRTEPRLRGELDAQPAWRASDPSAARASAFRRAVNPSPPVVASSLSTGTICRSGFGRERAVTIFSGWHHSLGPALSGIFHLGQK